MAGEFIPEADWRARMEGAPEDIDANVELDDGTLFDLGVCDWRPVLAGDTRDPLFAVACESYTRYPSLLKRENREVYEYLKRCVFGGREFDI